MERRTRPGLQIPIIATLGPPGSGKTQFLREFGEQEKDRLVVACSFNAGTPWDGRTMPIESLCIRALCSYISAFYKNEDIPIMVKRLAFTDMYGIITPESLSEVLDTQAKRKENQVTH